MKNKVLLTIGSIVAVGTFFVSNVAFAQATLNYRGRNSVGVENSQKSKGESDDHRKTPVVLGTVTSINGNVLMVTDNRTKIAYTVDATNATVMKDRLTSSVSDIAVNDVIMVQGAVNGTSVTALSIRDGFNSNMGSKKDMSPRNVNPIIQGDGQPVVGGKVTAINGNVITITNSGNVTYTVDVSSATIKKGVKNALVSDIVVGDNVLVQGSVNGTSITATSLIDKTPNAVTTIDSDDDDRKGGFFQGFKGFFQRLFNFF